MLIKRILEKRCETQVPSQCNMSHYGLHLHVNSQFYQAGKRQLISLNNLYESPQVSSFDHKRDLVGSPCLLHSKLF